MVEIAKDYGLTQITRSAISNYRHSTFMIKEGALTEYSIYFILLFLGYDIEIKVNKSKRTPDDILKKMMLMFPEVGAKENDQEFLRRSLKDLDERLVKEAHRVKRE